MVLISYLFLIYFILDYGRTQEIERELATGSLT